MFGTENFDGTEKCVKAEQWIQQLEDIFEILECKEIEKRKLVVFQLSAEARNWWEQVKSTIGIVVVTRMTWGEFKEKFLERYFSDTEKESKEIEFMDLKQETMKVTDYQNKFEALTRFAPHLIDTPAQHAKKFAR